MARAVRVKMKWLCAAATGEHLGEPAGGGPSWRGGRGGGKPGWLRWHAQRRRPLWGLPGGRWWDGRGGRPACTVRPPVTPLPLATALPPAPLPLLKAVSASPRSLHAPRHPGNHTLPTKVFSQPASSHLSIQTETVGLSYLPLPLYLRLCMYWWMDVCMYT